MNTKDLYGNYIFEKVRDGKSRKSKIEHPSYSQGNYMMYKTFFLEDIYLLSILKWFVYMVT